MGKIQAVLNGVVVAEMDDSEKEMVEGNYYFPASSIHNQYFKPSGTNYTCGWKGTCDYYDVTAGGTTSSEAAWVYKTPKEAAKNIAGRYAFWKAVKVVTK